MLSLLSFYDMSSDSSRLIHNLSMLKEDYRVRRVNKDEEYLGKMRDFYMHNHILPLYSTIAELTDMTPSAAFQMVRRLKKKGYLKSFGRQLQPGPRFFESALVSTVQFRDSMTASSQQSIGIDIARHVLKSPSTSVLLKVNDHSMIEAGLMPGDYVVVQRHSKAVIGDIVVVPTDQGYTIKHLVKEDDGSYIQADSNPHKDPPFKRTLEVFGVVTGSFRSYSPRGVA
jgi:DNA polymerase V